MPDDIIRRAPRRKPAIDYDPPGSRYGDPADLARHDAAWRACCARIDREDAARPPEDEGRRA